MAEERKAESEGLGDGARVPDDPLRKNAEGQVAGLSSTPQGHATRARQGGDTGRRHAGDVDPAQSDEEPRYARPIGDGGKSGD
ncbi:MAG TPA: hypothetical protein VED40_03540 [Azospirillaceae bacterium]|nr:hypothetical protein [Azospirillaceae bacterium]